MRTRYYTSSHTSVDDNLDNFFNTKDWKIEANKAELNYLVVTLSTLQLLEVQKYDQFFKPILTSKVSAPSSGFYEGDGRLLSRRYLLILRPLEIVIPSSLRGRLRAIAHLTTWQGTLASQKFTSPYDSPTTGRRWPQILFLQSKVACAVLQFVFICTRVLAPWSYYRSIHRWNLGITTSLSHYQKFGMASKTSFWLRTV